MSLRAQRSNPLDRIKTSMGIATPAKELVSPAIVLYVGQVGEQVALAMTN
jgi:hypothetical protein